MKKITFLLQIIFRSCNLLKNSSDIPGSFVMILFFTVFFDTNRQRCSQIFPSGFGIDFPLRRLYTRRYKINAAQLEAELWTTKQL